MDRRKYNLLQLSSIFLSASLGCVFFLFVRVLVTRDRLYSFLLWNLFLSWIPYLISMLILFLLSRENLKFKGPIIGVFGFLWLLFFPNAPYIFTDIIHIVRMPALTYRHTLLSPNSILWYDITLNLAFAFIGHIIGLTSLLIVHKICENRYDKGIAWVFVCFVMLLSGFGIYVGRFIRLNSWDILNDTLNTVLTLLDSISFRAVLFSMVFGFFIFLTYLIIYSLQNLYFTERQDER